tara:strand:- start:14677 stop:16059 length:1383 start_codon:yes stop_codon:yes gene_type:complete
MSLIDIAAELEYVPQDQLVQLANDPNSRYPTYLVLSEVQRRNQMKQMYDNQMVRQNQPSTTVAEEAVMELSQGAMPSSAEVSSPLDAGITSMAPPSPQMGMASGGLTAFANGGSTSTQRSFLISLGVNPDIISKMSDEEINQGIEKIRSGSDKSFLERGFDYVKENPFSTALAVASIHPAVRFGKWAGTGAYNLGKAGLSYLSNTGLGQFARNVISSRGRNLFRSPGYPTSFANLSDDAAYQAIKMMPGLGRFSLGRTSGTLGTLAVPGAVSEFLSDDAPAPTPPPTPQPDDQTPPPPPPDNTGDVNPYDKANALEAERLREEQGLMLAQLGGIIGSSKTLGEIASGIGGLATNISERRRADRIREEDILRAQPKSEAELGYIQQQTEVLQAQIENMPRKDIETSISLVTEALQEGAGDPEALRLYLGQLILRLQKLDGYDPANAALGGNAHLTGTLNKP